MALCRLKVQIVLIHKGKLRMSLEVWDILFFVLVLNQWFTFKIMLKFLVWHDFVNTL